jgi:hypothetical protein
MRLFLIVKNIFGNNLIRRYCSWAIFRSLMSDIELKQPKFFFSSEFCDSLTGTKETRCSRNQFQCQHHLQSQSICYIVVLKVLKLNKSNGFAHEQLPRSALNPNRFSDHESANFQRQHYQYIIKPVDRECNYLLCLTKFLNFYMNKHHKLSSWGKLNLTNLERKVIIE